VVVSNIWLPFQHVYYGVTINMLADILINSPTTLGALPWARISAACFMFFVLERIATVAVIHASRPRGMKIRGYPLFFGKWLSEFDFIFKGADRLVQRASELGTGVFAIPALSCYQVLVSKHEQILEFTKANEDSMSFRAAMNERLFFKHTMFGFELNDVDPHDSIPRRVFKTLARENLPSLSAVLSLRVKEVFARIKGVGEGAMQPGDTSVVSAFDISKSLIARMNNQLLFGNELAEDDKFEEHSVRYAWHTIILMQVLRQIPSVFVPLVAKLFLFWSGSMQYVGSHVHRVVKSRLENRKEGNEKARLDATEWVISSSTTPMQLAPTRLAQQMIALLFASMHQMQMTTCWAIVDLCQHKEHIETLRQEIHDVFQSNVKNPYDKLHFMDCFLRESSRLNTLDGLTTQRKAMRPFTFSDGSHIPAGNLVAIPQKVIMRDPERYQNPDNFDPYRYIPEKTGADTATTKYTDVNWNYTFWGSPRKSCPGKWYASFALKHILVHILTNYDIELVRPDAPRHHIWTTAIVPRSDIYMNLRLRAPDEAKQLFC
jgi:cytochrome P450